MDFLLIPLIYFESEIKQRGTLVTDGGTAIVMSIPKFNHQVQLYHSQRNNCYLKYQHTILKSMMAR